MREALPVLLAKMPAKKAKRLPRGFRRVTRALGPVRELDVTLGVLDERGRTVPDETGSLRAFAAVLHAERDRRQQEMLGRLENVDAERLVARLDSIWRHGAPAAACRRAVREPRRPGRPHRAARAEAAGGRDGAGALYAPEPLHAVRIATKKLRYALELAHDLRLLPSRRPLRSSNGCRTRSGASTISRCSSIGSRPAQAEAPLTEAGRCRSLDGWLLRSTTSAGGCTREYVAGRDRAGRGRRGGARER